MKKLLLFSFVFLSLLGAENSYSQNCNDGFKTFTNGGWGANCSGGNAGCYRDANFSAAFPNGLTIGCGSKTIKLTSSAAVEAFLPSGTSARTLDNGNLVNPGDSYKNVLVGQLVALTLSAVFDAYDVNYSTNTGSFSSLTIASGAFSGMSVTSFLQIANQVIGGCSTAYSISDVNTTASTINLNYDNGTVNNGYLICNLFETFSINIESSVSCYGDKTGEVTVSTTGGNGPYTFSLNTGETSGSITDSSYKFKGLKAGNYTVTVTDAAGAKAAGTSSFTLTEPSQIIVITSKTDASCFEGTNGTANIEISGGTPPYSILWANGGTTNSLTGLVAGTYDGVVTCESGCSVPFSVIIEQPTLLSSSTSLVNVSCHGGSNGSATVTAIGGTAPYSILWDDNSTSFTRSGLIANATYTAVVTDANGCQSNVSTSVTEPTLISVVTSKTNVSCFEGTNGTANIEISGGTAPYSILWANRATTNSITGLAAGTYDGVVTDNLGCTMSYSVIIEQPTVLSESTSVVNVSCHGGSNASATVTAIGGTAPYSILWDDNSTSFTRSGLIANATYTAVVTDANGCQSNVSTSVTEPTLISVVTSKTNVSCFEGTNGTANIEISGGTAPYSILWANRATTNSITGLAAGTYDGVVTDNLGCTMSYSVNIEQPTVLSESTSVVNVSCHGGSNGSATVTVIGGTAPYSILWDDNSTSYTRSSLVANTTYKAVVTDAKGCQTNVSTSVTQPIVLALSVIKTDVTCLGGSGTATANVSGGTSPYNYSWDLTPIQNSQTASLPVGTWDVKVTDTNGCSVSSNISLVLLSCEGFTTITPGGYGAKCSGNNWGCYVVNNFAAKFPNGLTIGSGTRLIKFTSAAAVQAFLPSGTTARALNAGTLTNPTAKTYSNVLAGHTIALSLSLRFDSNPNFSPSSLSLGNLIMSSGTFAGKTVNEILTIANTILGGGSSPYSAAQINDALDKINRNYDNGTLNLGYLACPCNQAIVARFTNTSAAPKTNLDSNLDFIKTSAVLYPNPVTENANFDFTIHYDSKIKIELYTINGQYVSTIYDNVAKGGNPYCVNINTTSLSSGMYLLKLSTNKEAINKTILVSK